MSRIAIASFLLLAACVDQRQGIEGTQSLAVDLGATPLGTPDDPLGPTDRTLTVQVTALNEDRDPDTTFTGDVDVYVQFLGSLTPALDDEPLIQIPVDAGESGVVNVDLPPVFGPALLWVEDKENGTYATGTSPTLWYENPHVADISTPEDLGSIDALQASPLELKQVSVTASRYGDAGHLVVTGVYAQGYTVSDVECTGAGATPPCTPGDFDHVLVFTFSRPRDEQGRTFAAGQVIDGFTGAVQEFNGLTEIGFPQTFVEVDGETLTPNEELIPDPAVIDAAWLEDTIEMEKRESGLVAIEGATVCELDDDYTTYKQWKLDIGAGCDDPINVITAGIAELDPADYVGQVMPRVVGTLRPVNIDSFNVWIVYPRGNDDLTLP